MKTLQQIQDEYAKKQGYESWEELFNYNVEYQEYEVLENAFNAVIHLVQDELLNKVTENVKNLLESEKVGEIFIEDYQLILKSILNTENIK